MGDTYDIGIDIKRTESIKEQLKNLSQVIESEFGYFCRNKNGINSPDTPDDFSKSLFNILYTSWRMEDFSYLNIKSILNIVKRNQYIMTCFYFLVIFTGIYFFTLFLYTKCFRKLLRVFICKTCRKKKEEKEKEKMNKNILENVRKRLFNIITYCFLCFLLCLLITVGAWFLYRFAKTRNGIHTNICNVSRSIEQLLVDKCSDSKGTHEVCYSVEHIVRDATEIMEHYKDVKDVVRKEALLDEDRPIPVLSKYFQSFEKLKKLKRNIHSNNTILEEQFYHTYPVLSRLSQSLQDVIEEGEKNLQNASDTVEDAKYSISAAFKSVDTNIEKTYKENMEKVTSKLEQASSQINKIINKYKIKENINKYTVSIVVTKLILLLPPLFILVGLLLFMYFLIKGDIANRNNLFLDLFGVFSAYFGFLTIITLAMSIMLLTISVLGGTSCIISDRILKNELTFEILNDTTIDYCLKNKESPLIEENMTKNIVDTINSFKTGDIENKIMEYGAFFSKVKEHYKENTNTFMDYIWVVIVKGKRNKYVDAIRFPSLRTSILGTGITRDNVHFGKWNLWGVDEFLKHLNAHFFNRRNGKLCYQDKVCENDNIHNYNITSRSSIQDPKYIALRNQLPRIDFQTDLDNVINLFIFKARITTENIFDINELDNTVTEKIKWDEYTPRNKTNEVKRKSIIQTYFVETIDDLNFTDILNFFIKIKEQFNSLKTLILGKIETLVRNTNCSRLVTEQCKFDENAESGSGGGSGSGSGGGCLSSTLLEGMMASQVRKQNWNHRYVAPLCRFTG
ncbi:hypothetical protein, conserved [Plasmodium ovale wallikeri]|uniref:Uncharacterized protein n=1 Tax=Plasmodium ovale wallikeri TaxID=864142 RepID=A0A1A8YIJ2_PLAOA|nr:hypothetical protein, conserved [Plasmodium ovale wallikeri]